MTRTEQIQWTLGNGRTATVTLTLVDEDRGETAYADGWNAPTTAKQATEIKTRVELDGKLEASWITERVTPEMRRAAADAAALAGSVVIREAQMTEIRAARSRLEETPEWQAHVERQAAKKAELDEYEAGRAKMRNVMGY